MRYILFLVLFTYTFIGSGQSYTYKIGLLKYNGGGDWYANPTALTNLIEFSNK